MLLRTCVWIMQNRYILPKGRPKAISMIQKAQWVACRHLHIKTGHANNVHTTCTRTHQQETERLTVTV